MTLSDNIKSKLPHWIVTLLFGLSIWLLIRAVIKYFSLWIMQIGFSTVSIPLIIGKPLNNPYLIEMFLSFIILIVMWLLSTRVSFYQEIKMRLITFGVMISGIVMQFLWNASVPVFEDLIPYIIKYQNMVYIGNAALEGALFNNTPNLMLFLLSLPAICLFIVVTWLVKLCNEHWSDLIEFFKEFQYNVKIPGFVSIFMSDDKKRKVAKDIKEFFDEKQPEIIPLPDVALGPNKKTSAMVIQRGKDRTLNNLIIGAIGTGKTSALVLPIINQDLHHMAFMINNYEKYYKLENYHSEDIKGRFLNGLSIIEPSKDLCDKTFELVKAHGIPEEVVFYIDPTNPNTPSLNLFKGPTDKVAEMFTMVVSGIGESQEFFFEQSQRSHLKHHIYLLKEHDPDTDVGFEELINMYNDAQLVASMHLKLKQRLSLLGELDEIEDRDQRNYLLILKGISDWFDMTYVPVDKGFGKNMQPDIITEGPYRGQQRVEDVKSEHVVGLRNILNDIASNILLRRVLFGKSDFDFDKHLEYGGILLVNTAKGELSSLSDVLGKFCLLSLQNAVFRRKPNDSPYHHILVDEFPDYINEDFGSFPAQSRKYKAIITVVAQTVSQLQRKYGPDFMTTLVATLRNKFVYGDGTQLDAEMFSTIFGDKKIFEESESDQEVSPLMDSPNRRTGKSYTKTERANMTVSEMIYQDAFVAAVKLVENNRPIPAQQVKANFVPKEEFKEAVIKVNDESAHYWLEIRRSSLLGNTSTPDTSSSIQDATSVFEDEDFDLPDTPIHKPLKPVNYQPSTSTIIDQSMFKEKESPDTMELGIETEILEPNSLIAKIKNTHENRPLNLDEQTVSKKEKEQMENELATEDDSNGNKVNKSIINIPAKSPKEPILHETSQNSELEPPIDGVTNRENQMLEKRPPSNNAVTFEDLFANIPKPQNFKNESEESEISKDNPFELSFIKPIAGNSIKKEIEESRSSDVEMPSRLHEEHTANKEHIDWKKQQKESYQKNRKDAPLPTEDILGEVMKHMNGGDKK